MFRWATNAARAPYDLWLLVLLYLPGEAGAFLRYRHWRKRLKMLGPNVRFGVGVKLQNPAYISIAENCWIDDYVIIMAGPDSSSREKRQLENSYFVGDPGTVHIGRNVHVSPFCIISGISAGVYISDDCGLSSGCKIYAFSHHYRSKKNPSDYRIGFGPMVPHSRQSMIEGPVMIGRNTGLALNSIVLPGVYIPRDCFVSPNSVVKPRLYKPNSILEGSPAKVAGERYLTES